MAITERLTVTDDFAARGRPQNAFLLTGQSKYKEWLLRYVGGWMERAEAQVTYMYPLRDP